MTIILHIQIYLAPVVIFLHLQARTRLGAQSAGLNARLFRCKLANRRPKRRLGSHLSAYKLPLLPGQCKLAVQPSSCSDFIMRPLMSSAERLKPKLYEYSPIPT